MTDHQQVDNKVFICDIELRDICVLSKSLVQFDGSIKL